MFAIARKLVLMLGQMFAKGRKSAAMLGEQSAKGESLLQSAGAIHQV